MDIFEGIEKTIYEHLRLELIAQGLTVDVLDYATATEYETALAALDLTLQAQGLNVVTVKGLTFNEFKYAKAGNYFSLEAVGIDNGSIGATGCITYEDNGDNTFKKLLSPDQTVDVQVRVRIVANNLKVYRRLKSLQFSVLGHSKYLVSIDDGGSLTGDRFLLVNRGMVPELADEFKEALTMYVAKDIWPHLFTVIEEALPRLEEIQNEEIAVNNLDSV